VGLIGIALIIIVTAFTGLTKEHDLGVAFTNAMPFAALIVVFFAILGVVHVQHLITPLAEWVFTFDEKSQLLALYFTNGALSFVSDNVFIATIFIGEVESVYADGVIAQMLDGLEAAYADGTILQFLYAAKSTYDSEIITQFINSAELAYADGTFAQFMSEVKIEYAENAVISREWYEKLAVVVNMGTNIPAMATPNGHAALLFLLTSSLASLLKLSYIQMIKLTLPYTIAMTVTGALAIHFFL
jgi:NhaB family Na+:H+ antiporter